MTDPGYPGASTPDPNYPPPPPPPGYPSADDKTWALVAHFGGAAGNLGFGFLGWVAPLIALLSKGPTSPTVRQHALAAINFQIPVSAVALFIYIIRDAAFSGGGWAFGDLLNLADWGVAIIGIVFGVIGGIRANDGVLFRYPLNVNIVT